MVLVTTSLEHLRVFHRVCPWMRDTDLAIAVFSTELGDVKYSMSQEYASTTSHVTRMILQEDWQAISRMMDARFEVSSCSQWWHWWGRVGKGMEEHPPQQVPSGTCGHPNSSDRVYGEQRPCFNLCISPRCSCVPGGIASPSAPRWDWKHSSACLHKLSFPPARMCQTHPCKAAQRSEQHVPARVGNGTGEKSPTKVTPCHPRTQDVSIALDIHGPREIHPWHSPGRLCSLWQPTWPSLMPAGATQNPKIAPQKNVVRCGELLVSSQPTAGGVFIF